MIMAPTGSNSLLPFSSLICPVNNLTAKPNYCKFLGSPLFPKNFGSFMRSSSHLQQVVAVAAALVDVKEVENVKKEEEERPKFKWLEIGPNITEAQKQAISGLPYRMTKRCKALMRQIICRQQGGSNSLSDLLGAWVRIMKPTRADWLSVLRELKKTEHALYIQEVDPKLAIDSIMGSSPHTHPHGN